MMDLRGLVYLKGNVDLGFFLLGTKLTDSVMFNSGSDDTALATAVEAMGSLMSELKT